MATSMISDGVTQSCSSSIAAASMRAMSRRSRNSRVEAIELVLGETGLQLAALFGQRRVLEVAHGHADGGQRRPQIVADRGEQRRGKVGALPDQLRLLALAEQLGAFDGHRREPGHRVEGARVERVGADCEQPDRACPEAKRHEPDLAAPRVDRPAMARVGAGARIELERGAGLRERRRQVVSSTTTSRPAPWCRIPAAGRRQADCQRRELEALRDAPGEHVERAMRSRWSAGRLD